MDRRDFIKRAIAAGAAGGFVLSNEKLGLRLGQRPNVIIMMTDDQGYHDLHCTGNPHINTPSIDSLYKQSVRLADFHVSPTCSPTRAALLTGHSSNRTGVWHTIMGRSLLRKDQVCMGDVFKTSGYRTGMFGKWHLGDNYPFRPQDRGFQDVVMHGGGGIGQGPDYWGNDYFDDVYLRNGVEEQFTGYCTDVFFDEAMRFIEENKDQPFFCYLPTNAPHGPLNVADKYSQPYIDMGVSSNQAKFYGMITNIDENMGKLMKKLSALGIDKNTILIWMTDNGSSNGYKELMRGGKGSEYDGGHRVPCFWRWPGGGLTGARDVTRLTAHVDMLPTLIEICDLKHPEGVVFDGKSIVPLLNGDDSGWSERTIITDSQRIEYPEKWKKSATMTDQWRLVNGTELYDIKEDPLQATDVASLNPSVMAQLTADYDAWWDSISPSFDLYAEIIIGNDAHNPTRLMSHDWHENPNHSQSGVKNATTNNGFWVIDIERDGTYEFELRRWPKELDVEITGNISGGTAINATEARIVLGAIDQTMPIPAGAKEVTFQLSLTAGSTTLRTYLNDPGTGETHGAYYVYARRV